MTDPLSPPLTHLQARSVRRFGAVCCVYLLLLGLGWMLLLQQRGVAVDLLVRAACVAPALIALGLWRRPVRDARQAALNAIAATLALPLMLIFWAGSLDPAPTLRAPFAEAGLDADRLVAGARSVQDAPLQNHGIVLMRSAAFDDRSELRLTRFDDAELAAAHLLMLRDALQGEPYQLGERRMLRLGGPVLALVLLERHGADLLELRAANAEQALARLAQQQVPLVRAALPSSAIAAQAPSITTTPAPLDSGWLITIAMLLHLACCVALMFWAGHATTGVPAEPGVAAVPLARLRARVQSLAAPLGGVTLHEAEDGTLALAMRLGARREHRVSLRFDAAHQRVQVQEVLRVDGDAPADADEASMRDPGDDLFDASRPEAQRIWTHTRQTTMVLPQRLTAVPLTLFADEARLPPGHAERLDGEGLLTTLCALVTRSGWQWQPRFFGGGA
jgi:hypothetical protein